MGYLLGPLPGFVVTIGMILIYIEKVKKIEFHKTKTSAETANRTETKFFANISHEIRAQMNGIIGTDVVSLLYKLLK